MSNKMTVDGVLDSFGLKPKKYLDDVILSEDYSMLRIGPRVDATCGGGIKEGSVVLISGNEKLGKSTLCLSAIVAAQSLNDKKDRQYFYYDVENKVQQRDIKIEGLDYDKVNWIGSQQNGILTAEAIFQSIERLTTIVSHSIFVIDSLTMVLTQSEMNYEFDKTFRADSPRATSIFLRKIIQLLRPNKNTLFCILQNMANQDAGPYSPKDKEGGGKKIQYAGNYKFKLTHVEPELKDDVRVGNKVHFNCVFHPAAEVSENKSYFYHTFNHGVDKLKEYVECGVDIGFVKKKGAWFSYKESKMNGFSNLCEFFKENPAEFEELKKEVDAVIYEN